MHEADVQLLASASQAIVLDAKIRQLEAEAAIFKRDSRCMFDSDTETYLRDERELSRAQSAGHRIIWAIHPALDKADVEHAWASMQAELDTLKNQRDEFLRIAAGDDHEN